MLSALKILFVDDHEGIRNGIGQLLQQNDSCFDFIYASNCTQALEEAAKNVGVDLRKNSKVVDIISENGKAAGVIVETKNGKQYKIMAKAVIIASGGFGASPEMVVKYKSNLDGFGTTNHKGATGDAFAWVEKFNAQLTMQS